MAASIADTDSSTPLRTIVPIKATGSRVPFFCIHGRAEALVRYLDEEQPFYWLHHGQDAERTPYMTVEVIAAMHLEEIREIQSQGPYLLGGFSFGGLLALEIATQLRDHGEQVALLALFDPSAPHLSTELKAKVGTTLEAVSSAEGLWGKISAMVSKAVSIGQRRVRTLRRRLDTRRKMFEIRRRQRSGRELPPDLGVFRLVQQFRRAARIYDYRPYPGPVTLFVPEGRRSAVKQRERLERQWRGIAMEGLDIQRVQGAVGHHQIVEEPYVRDLVEKLNACLTEVQASRAQS
jgi:thioesterase domain-containing protein